MGVDVGALVALGGTGVGVQVGSGGDVATGVAVTTTSDTHAVSMATRQLANSNFIERNPTPLLLPDVTDKC